MWDDLLDHFDIQNAIVLSLSISGQIALEMFNWSLAAEWPVLKK
jgi:hypothetical protein